ncbi:MAG: hypothetical protein IPO86_04485 [Saprospiraceae bacterium]|nr:hypothetical protein [Saprospiraceae bacterium]
MNTFLNSSLILTCLFLQSNLKCQLLVTPFEKNNRQSTNYYECIAFYKNLEKSSKLIKVYESGASDVSYPIHTVIISTNKEFDPQKTRRSGKAVLLINNGIHPGEPDGIDASMIFARELINDPFYRKILDHLTIVIIPIYNVGGSLLRNKHSRANQNGPEEYGFRGNSQNLDLNRDFIKCDSKNAETFTKLFQFWNPDVFLETHTSDGADYPYSMTLISSQRHKMQSDLGNYMYTKFLPNFLSEMKDNGLEVCPYVMVKEDPINGIYDFLDLPRYSTGYASLFHTISFMSESHMLKSYDVRVNSQKKLIKSLASLTALKKTEILEFRKLARIKLRDQKLISLNWILQSDQFDSLNFRGYKQDTFTSEVTGLARYKYNPSKLYEKKIPYYNVFKSNLKIEKPDAYVIPAAYTQIIERLKWNGVRMQPLQKDSLVEAEYYRIIHYNSPQTPYENHYLHAQVNVDTVHMKKLYFKGDYIIPTDQDAVRYIVETLEPHAPDSYFAWNFFDGILQRKEYFSDYLFEDVAPDLLKNNLPLKTEFEKKKKEDPEFSKDANEMLHFIYSKSMYSEAGYMIYPVARWFSKMKHSLK